MTVQGVKVDLPKLQQTFSTAKPEVRDGVGQVAFSMRYNQYAEALTKLQALAANPDLTEPQKKIVSDVIEQVKQVLAKAPSH